MKIRYDLEEAEVQVLLDYINYVNKGEGVAQAGNAIHLTNLLRAGYENAVAKKSRKS